VNTSFCKDRKQQFCKEQQFRSHNFVRKHKIYNMIRRQPARKLSIRKRHLQLHAQGKARGDILRRVSIVLLHRCRQPNATQQLFHLTRAVIASYFSLTCITAVQWNLAPPPRWHNSFDSFATEDCYNMFRFEKRDFLLSRQVRLRAHNRISDRF
jgi:hypothetical protein